LSNDDTPDYKTQANNYSDDDEEREYPFSCAGEFSSRFNQSVKILSF
jgi:RNA polymerase sigma-54 factor